METHNYQDNRASLSITFDTVRRVLDTLRIPYTLVWGTAIGVLRDEDFIKWDYDVDVAVEYEDLGDPGKLDKAMRAAGVKSSRPMPFTWDCRSQEYPILFQYTFPAGSPCDIYVHYRHSGQRWDYSVGGEHTGRGLGVPDVAPVHRMFRGGPVRVMHPDQLDAAYTNWRVPDPSGGSAAGRKPVPNDSGCVLPPPRHPAVGSAYASPTATPVSPVIPMSRFNITTMWAGILILLAAAVIAGTVYLAYRV